MKEAGQGHDISCLGFKRTSRLSGDARTATGTVSLVYCDCHAEGAGLFFIRTQRLSVGLLQGLSDVLPVNAANLITFPFSVQVYSGSVTIPLCLPSPLAAIKE